MMEKNQKRRKEAFATPTSSTRSTPASSASLASSGLTKSADNRSRASSNRSVTSSTKSVNQSDDDLGSALSKPELITGYDLRAHLQQIMKFSDDDLEDDDDDDTLYSSSEEDCSIESFDDKDDRDDELRKLALESNDDAQARTPLPTGMNNCQSLVPITEEEDEELDSEEENEMMKEIRLEIVKNVRQEMKSELELYKAKLKKLENGEDGTPDEASSDTSAGNAQPDLDNLDPKLRAAIIKMKKLDKLLSKRVKREKEVKRDRILLERRMKREIEEINREKKDEYKEVLNNEQKFLALELPARHNEDVTPIMVDCSDNRINSFICSVKDLYSRRLSSVHNDTHAPVHCQSESTTLGKARSKSASHHDKSSKSKSAAPDMNSSRSQFAVTALGNGNSVSKCNALNHSGVGTGSVPIDSSDTGTNSATIENDKSKSEILHDLGTKFESPDKNDTETNSELMGQHYAETESDLLDKNNAGTKCNAFDIINSRTNCVALNDSCTRSEPTVIDSNSVKSNSAIQGCIGFKSDQTAPDQKLSSKNTSAQSDNDITIQLDPTSRPKSTTHSEPPETFKQSSLDDLSSRSTVKDDISPRSIISNDLASSSNVKDDLFPRSFASDNLGNISHRSRSESVTYRDLVLSTTYDILLPSHSPTCPPVQTSQTLSEIHLDLSDIGTDVSDQTEGVTVPDEFTGEEVFATQLNEDEYPGLGHKLKSRKGQRSSRSSVRSDKDSERTGGSDDERSHGDSSSVASGSVDGKKHKKKRKKDFIKRNKELAGDAANMIAMTDEEKKRLDELLRDVEEIPEIAHGMELDDSNPFQLAVKPGEGFHPEPDDARSLTSIDSRLKELLPPDDYRSIASSSMSHIPQTKLFTNTGVKHGIEWENRGERALFQNAEQRDMNERMLAIEQELAEIKNREDSELETPRLGEDQLKDLIDQCVTSLSYTSMSRMTLNSESRTSFADTESVVSHNVDGTTDNTPRSPRSARQEILDNPPKLAPDVLQKLLSEAYHPLSKQLSTLKEEDLEGDEETTPIPSEVWKLISMETGEESQSIDSTVKSSYDSQVLTSVSESFDDPNNMASMLGKNPVNSRNGFRALSRNSSASSLASVSEIGTGRDTREKEPLKLPDIDPTGSLVTQGLNSQRRAGSSNSSVRTPTNFVQNSLTDSKSDILGPCDSRLELLSLDGEIISPHPPPSREKREGGGNKREDSGNKREGGGNKREGSGNKSRNGSRAHIL